MLIESAVRAPFRDIVQVEGVREPWGDFDVRLLFLPSIESSGEDDLFSPFKGS